MTDIEATCLPVPDSAPTPKAIYVYWSADKQSVRFWTTEQERMSRYINEHGGTAEIYALIASLGNARAKRKAK